jgi:hypothetical protein
VQRQLTRTRRAIRSSAITALELHHVLPHARKREAQKRHRVRLDACSVAAKARRPVAQGSSPKGRMQTTRTCSVARIALPSPFEIVREVW